MPGHPAETYELRRLENVLAVWDDRNRRGAIGNGVGWTIDREHRALGRLGRRRSKTLLCVAVARRGRGNKRVAERERVGAEGDSQVYLVPFGDGPTNLLGPAAGGPDHGRAAERSRDPQLRSMSSPLTC